MSGGPERDVDPGDDAADDRADDRYPRVAPIGSPLAGNRQDARARAERWRRRRHQTEPAASCPGIQRGRDSSCRGTAYTACAIGIKPSSVPCSHAPRSSDPTSGAAQSLGLRRLLTKRKTACLDQRGVCHLVVQKMGTAEAPHRGEDTRSLDYSIVSGLDPGDELVQVLGHALDHGGRCPAEAPALMPPLCNSDTWTRTGDG